MSCTILNDIRVYRCNEPAHWNDTIYAVLVNTVESNLSPGHYHYWPLAAGQKFEVMKVIAGTFSVDVEDLSKHRMDGERIIISEQAASEINRTKRSGHKICAVGVTVIRALETYVTTNHEVRPTDTWTNKFIFPPYEFSVPDAIVSNFHLPESTMLMSVAAFGGYEKVMNAYQSALDNDYRFGPYGDALLIV